MVRVVRHLILCVLAAVAVTGLPAAARTPAEVADELLAADRAFSAASMKTDTVSGITAMFADDVVTAVPGGKFARTKAEAVAALRTNPLNLTSHAEWTPIRVAISADGLHGFTIGYMTMHDKEGPARQAKYLAYWIRGDAGWRVAAYKRGPRGAGDFSTEMLAPILPARLVAPSKDAGALATHRKSIDAAERTFSDEAQIIGIGPAFCKHGAPQAMHLGGPTPTFTVGVDNICKNFDPVDPAGPKSPVSWAPNDVLVASSGDLGITWGLIKQNSPPPSGQPAGSPSGNPYSTIWYREGPGQPWKYIAE